MSTISLIFSLFFSIITFYLKKLALLLKMRYTLEVLAKTNAQVAEQVDAQDLKSCEIQPSCRFKSDLRHHLFGGIPKSG